MSINKLAISTELRETLSAADCWAVCEADIERLASRIVGDFQVPLLRRGNMRTIIAGKRFGSDATRFAEEFRQFASQCAVIRDGSAEAEVCAAAFFHLRHGNIHPLTDCNGRLGRLLLAEQFYRFFGIVHEQTLQAIHFNEREYRAAFVEPLLDQQFRCMVELLARIANVRMTKHAVLPFSTLPVFEEPNTRIFLPKERVSRPKSQALRKRLVAVGVGALFPRASK